MATKDMLIECYSNLSTSLGHLGAAPVEIAAITNEVLPITIFGYATQSGGSRLTPFDPHMPTDVVGSLVALHPLYISHAVVLPKIVKVIDYDFGQIQVGVVVDRVSARGHERIQYIPGRFDQRGIINVGQVYQGGIDLLCRDVNDTHLTGFLNVTKKIVETTRRERGFSRKTITAPDEIKQQLKDALINVTHP